MDTFAWTTTANFRERLENLEFVTWRARGREEIRDLNTALTPGYYVSAMDNGRRILAEGPFPTHAEALVSVRGVRTAWERVDPVAVWYAWGTAQVLS